jgi:hypothetical protein
VSEISNFAEISDFARMLRRAADDADALAERHDLRHMAQLCQQVDEQAVKAQRDSDLIDELRRQVRAMGRSLDGIGRLRKGVLALKETDAVQILAEALFVLDGPCANYIADSWTCRTEGVGRTRGARYGAEAWCHQCVAHDALERAGALPPAVD